MSFKTHVIEKIQYLVAVYYLLGKDAADNLKTLQNGWAFLDLNFYKVYSLIV